MSDDRKVIKIESISFFVDDIKIDKIDCFRTDRYGLFLEHSEDTRLVRS